jgi:penicillin-binding protein 1A
MSNIQKEMENHYYEKTKEFEANQFPEKKKKRRFIMPFLLLGLFIIQLAVIAGMMFLQKESETIIEQNASKIEDERYFQQTRVEVVDQNDKTIGALQYGQNSPMSIKKISEIAIDAQVSSEDGRFFEHDGTDYLRFAVDGTKFARAKLSGSTVSSGGASTITSQLVRLQITDRQAGQGNDGTQDSLDARTKIEEQMIARGLEQRYTKSKLLEYYMNNVPLSATTFGTNATAQKFYSVNASELNMFQALYISMTASSPLIYDPEYLGNDKDRIEIAQNHFDNLSTVFLNQNYINEFELSAMKAMNIEKSFNLKRENVSLSKPKAAYFTVIQEELLERYGIKFAKDENNKKLGRYKVYTALDENVQNKVYEVIENNASDKRYDMAFSLVEPKTGIIKGIYGGKGFNDLGDFVNSRDSERSPGSTTKPLIPYATFISKNKGGSQSLVPDKTIYYTGTNIKINNYDRKVSESNIPVRRALETSRNTSAVGTYRINENAGYKDDMDRIYDTLGFKDDGAEITKTYEGTPIGNQVKISSLNLAAAYGTFVNEGKYIKPHAIIKVVDLDGNELPPKEEGKIEEQQAFDSETAYILSDIGRTTVTGFNNPDATASRTQISALPFWNGGKTGTSEVGIPGAPLTGARDLWFAGYTSNYSYSIWSGFDKTQLENQQYVSDNDRPNQYKILSEIISATAKGDEKKPDRPANVSGVDNVSVQYTGGNNNAPGERGNPNNTQPITTPTNRNRPN